MWLRKCVSIWWFYVTQWTDIFQLANRWPVEETTHEYRSNQSARQTPGISVTEHEKFIDMVSHSTLQFILKRWLSGRSVVSKNIPNYMKRPRLRSLFHMARSVWGLIFFIFFNPNRLNTEVDKRITVVL